MSELFERASRLAAEKAAADNKEATKRRHKEAKKLREQQRKEKLSKERINEFVQILNDSGATMTPLYAETQYYGGASVGNTTKLCHVDNGWIITESYIDNDTEVEQPGIILHQNATVCNEFHRDNDDTVVVEASGTRIGWDEMPPEYCEVDPDIIVADGYFGADDAVNTLANALVRYGVL